MRLRIRACDNSSSLCEDRCLHVPCPMLRTLLQRCLSPTGHPIRNYAGAPWLPSFLLRMGWLDYSQFMYNQFRQYQNLFFRHIAAPAIVHGNNIHDYSDGGNLALCQRSK
jgi:hypothetical protein